MYLQRHLLIIEEAMDNLKFLPLTIETWPSFEKLFGPKGACGGCWCMTWRLQKADYERLKGDGNKKALQKLVRKDEPIGIIAFVGEEPAGWCAVAPREKFIRLQNSRVLKPIDDKPVWSVSCFFIAKPHRRKGLSVKLLKATLTYAKKEGAKIVEAYPVEPKDNKVPDVFAWTGILSSFMSAGFKEEKRHSEARPIVRYYL
jgi:GNAT superfamily N-acetyltransferase